MLLLLRCWMCVWLAVVPHTQIFCFKVNSTSNMEWSGPVLSTEKHHGREYDYVSNDTKEEASGTGYLDEAFEEQGYYLQRLFLQYGENGTLSYRGLQKLLGSLGLGEVSVLEIRHQGVKDAPPAASYAHSLHHPPASSSRVSHRDSFPDGIVWEEEGRAASDVLTGGKHLDSGNERKDHFRPSSVVLPSPGRSQSETPYFAPDHPTKNHLHGNCLNVTQLLWNFGLGQASHITPSHFTFLCPALLYQIDSGVCLQHTEEDVVEDQSGMHFLIALGWGSLALTLISLPSLLALGTVTLLTPGLLQSLLCPMVALAVGTLCGDALLHLLPHANSGSHSDSGMQNSILKGLCVLAGLYLLFLVESIMELHRHHKKENKEPHSSAQNVTGARELVPLQGKSSVEESRPPESSNEADFENRHEHPAPRHSGMASLVWMVVTGDGIHNFTDGLAIGAAFTRSLAGGLSTTVAVFCHELPHELGDFAVLLAAGWPIRRLLLFSGMSAALGFLGLVAGTVLGHHLAQLSPWILAVTAGIFLHVALTDMMPEMLHGECGPVAPLTRFLLQNVGLVAGVGIMLCIALFEDDIALSLGDG
ncbi:zinc transporter ZIP5 isoform X2 [Paramormyrops kingsleyae]|uniref:Solute carrier family 39 member 5 n=1 Tax=Paramormyrops kingsleyae TaxID=1676925 RepID=A0A3B3T9S1_9TELE|nr:zinc transporter ZIP10-like isoform X2 [Paramormyrops kingsleyae]